MVIYIVVGSIEYFWETVMSKKKNKEYTTIQVRKELNQHIKDFCRRTGTSTAFVTETLWNHHISSSLSGSFSI
jgi:hypothetical protein